MFTKEDIMQIEQRGSSVQTVEEQVERFRKGFPWLKIVAPATPAILPVPTVAARAVQTAWKGVMAPALADSRFRIRPTVHFMDSPNFRSCRNPVRILK